MPNLKSLLLLFTFLITSNFYSQESCGTRYTQNNEVYENSFSNDAQYCLKIKFHIVRKSDGTGGFNPSNINSLAAHITQNFENIGITFINIGFDYIDDTSLYYIDDIKPSETEFNKLTSTKNNPNSINYYIVNSAPYNGKANITGRNLVVKIDRVFTDTTPHEIGHNLSLLHTFQGTAEVPGCAELINGSNCSTCGDKVCDTPADANNGQINGYNPDMTNFMSYYTTRNHFTPQQILRMKNAINGAVNLQAVKSNQCKSITGENSVCQGISTAYTVEYLNGTGISWSVSGSLQIVSPATSNPVMIKGTTNQASSGILTATLSTGETISKVIYVGAPTPYNGNNSNSIWASNSMAVDFSFIQSYGATSYTWNIVKLPSDLPLATCITSKQAKFYNNNLQTINTTLPTVKIVTGSCLGDYLVTCTAKNSCGNTIVYERYLTVGRSGTSPCNNNISFSRFKIETNPIKGNSLKLIIEDKNKIDFLDEIKEDDNTSNIVQGDGPCEGPWTISNYFREKKLEITIYDMNGEKKFFKKINSNLDNEKKSSKSEEVTVENINLAPNKYILSIDDGNQLQKQIIIIE